MKKSNNWVLTAVLAVIILGTTGLIAALHQYDQSKMFQVIR